MFELNCAVYAAGKVMEEVRGVSKVSTQTGKERENRTQRKMIREMKECRQTMSRIANEMLRRKLNRRASHREKRIFQELCRSTGKSRSEGMNNIELILLKERKRNRLEMLKVRYAEYEKKLKRKKNNRLFQENEKQLYRSIEKSHCKGVSPPMQDHEEFWAELWETETKIQQKPWMVSIEKELKEKVRIPHETPTFQIQGLREEIKKRKNWTAPGIDGIQNFWWKHCPAVWEYLLKGFNEWMVFEESIPEWIATGRTILLPKSDDLSNRADYRPITCLNTMYKLFTGMIARDLKKHAHLNGIWDENQLGTKEMTLGTVDHWLVDKVMLNEIVEKRRNADIVYYDYRKAYDLVPHEWMQMVLKWIGLSRQVQVVFKKLQSMWKTRLEIVNGNTVQVGRLIKFHRGFFQGDSLSPVAFCLCEVPLGLMMGSMRGYRLGERQEG